MTRSNIILVGFMGTGKSATGKIVARRLEYKFLDMDSMIEERQGRTISSIFATDGEPAFRAMECDLIKELCELRNLVIAAGGGVVVNPENVEDFNRTGVVICLHASPSTILARVKVESHRPLLEDGDKAKRILELLESRKALYDAIPYRVDTTYLSPEGAADKVIELYEEATGTILSA